jgi:16S rRNA (cytosine967-C5)-methyltransferase
MNAPPTGLAARERAHTILHEVLDRGRPLDETLQSDQRFAKLPDRDRAFARNLVATTLRRLGQIDAMLAACLDKPLPRSAAAARNALRIGVCQVLFLDVQTHAAVDTAVSLCSRRGPDRFKGLVNAILRRIVREEAAFRTRFPETLDLPGWLRTSWTAAYGAERTDAIAAALLAPPPVDLTVRSEPARWAATLGGEALGGDTVRIPSAGDIARLPGFAEGAWWVQDAAAALPARLLASAVGAAEARVCDLCAAPGGKTLQLAAAGFRVTAVDVSAERLKLVRENLGRTGLAADIVKADAIAWRPETPFDGVLLDAPCSATGTIRRHPDIPHLKTPADVTRQASLQKKLLAAAAADVRPGGVLVYSVCSLQPEEGPRQIDDFLRWHHIFARDPIAASELPGFTNCITSDGDLITLPDTLAPDGNDGFFIARLRRSDGDVPNGQMAMSTNGRQK